QYLQETNLHLICIVDASESMGYGSVKGEGDATWTKYDHATAIAASLSYMAIQQQDSVGLAIFDQALSRYFKPSNSPGQWKVVVNELQQVPRWNKTNTGKILDQIAEKLNHRSLIVILSDFFDDIGSIQQGLRHLRYKKHELMVFQILDPMEINFPFEDVTLFKGLEGLGDLLTEPRALREGYMQQLNDFTEQMKKMCRGMHVDFQRFSSGDSLDVALSGFLATRAASIK
ncbi:MAG: VWA domain-containing protein, partial [Planctomycetota bacterium]|nr:VWA domain-containing protein [Planctomycetota bacterium]